jgi:hypothetical protein
MRHPGFAGEKDPYWIWHRLRFLKRFYDRLLDGIRSAIIPAGAGKTFNSRTFRLQGRRTLLPSGGAQESRTINRALRMTRSGARRRPEFSRWKNPHAVFGQSLDRLSSRGQTRRKRARPRKIVDAG